MLHTITTLDDPLLALIKDDPVRPDIPIEFRVSATCQVFVLLADDEYALPQAVVCVAYKQSVPRDVIELAAVSQDAPTVAVFYTIWSYTAGSGRKLIQSAQSRIKATHKSIKTFVTLSPPTDMARVFHLRNGAGVLSVNSDTVNYIYSNDD
jgi:predicted regulator of amino acid metabolism with ACT domain